MLVINFHEPQSYGSIFRKKGRGLPNAYDELNFVSIENEGFKISKWIENEI